MVLAKKFQILPSFDLSSPRLACPGLCPRFCNRFNLLNAARLAQLGERRSAEREAVGSNPGQTNTQGL